MDTVLHAERLDRKAKRLHPLADAVETLPDGAMIAAGADAFLMVGHSAFRWTPAGYHLVPRAPESARLLTPPSTVRTLAAGYRAVLHPSLGIS